jgi:hypothetical protein
MKACCGPCEDVELVSSRKGRECTDNPNNRTLPYSFGECIDEICSLAWGRSNNAPNDAVRSGASRGGVCATQVSLQRKPVP